MSIVQTDGQHCQTGRDGVGQPPEQAHFMASSQAATLQGYVHTNELSHLQK